MAWIASLWVSSSFWEALEYVAEAIVIIGVLLEGLADFEFILKGHENEQRRKRVESGAFLVLVIGLALSLTALMRTNQLFTETIATLYRESRDANNRATDAENMATASNGRAEMAFDKATEAQGRADRAEKQAGDAIVRASVNEKEAARLNKLAQDEAMARTELQARITPRTLTLAQRQVIAKTLRPFVLGFFGRPPIRISWSSIDAEETILGVEVEDVLTRAGIPFENAASLVLGNGLQVGIRITGTPRDRGFMFTLASLLHIDTDSIVLAEANDKYAGQPVTIAIGVKPPQGLETLPVRTAPTEAAVTSPKPVLDRHLTREQQLTAARQLRPFIGQRAMFVIPPGDREVLGIATEIDAALNAAGWIRSSGRPQNLGRLRGILIEVSNSATDTDRNAAEGLAAALREDRLDVIGPVRSSQVSRFRVAPIIITIGRNQ